MPDESTGLEWIDLQTTRENRSIYLCTSYNADCEKPDHPKTVMELVFSDEFEKDGRNMAATENDPRWTAVDMYYSRDDKEAQNYKPDAITTEGGALKITISKEQTVGTYIGWAAYWAADETTVEGNRRALGAAAGKCPHFVGQLSSASCRASIGCSCTCGVL